MLVLPVPSPSRVYQQCKRLASQMKDPCPRDSDLSYSLSTLPGKRNLPLPQSVEELARWLEVQSAGQKWHGKMYVASSIVWSGADFRQTGCSPNYLAGLWSLACCMHSMRSAKTFRKKVESGVPMFIFTLASKVGLDCQSLVSVVKVTRHFSGMVGYAKFLIAQRNPEIISSRFTRVQQSDRSLGWRFGDCHSNSLGQIGPPNENHVHGLPERYADDLNGKHLILFSNQFAVWKKKEIRARKVYTQKGFGVNVTPENVSQIFTPNR